MRVIKVVVAATMVLGAAAPAWTCDLDGPGGHRFFAFANMYRGGGEAEQPKPDRDTPGPEANERDRPSGDSGSNPGQSGQSEPVTQDPAASR